MMCNLGAAMYNPSKGRDRWQGVRNQWWPIGRNGRIDVLQQIFRLWWIKYVRTRNIQHRNDIRTKNGEIMFWIRVQKKYSCLHRIALRVFAAPISLMSSKGDFSFINRLLTANHACRNDDIIEDNAFLKSFFNFSKRLKNQSGWWN